MRGAGGGGGEDQSKGGGKGGETWMRDSITAVRAAPCLLLLLLQHRLFTPLFLRVGYLPHPPSPSSTSCVSHGSDLVWLRGVEQQKGATSTCWSVCSMGR